MASVAQRTTYPAAIDHKLRRVCRRQQSLGFARTILVALAALLLGMLVAMVIDWSVTLFRPFGRLLLTGLVLGSSAALLVVGGWRVLRAGRRLKIAARDVDRTIPLLEERWTTVASCVEARLPHLSAVDRAMLRQVTSEAVAMERLVDPSAIANPRQLYRPACFFSGALLLVAFFLALNWPYHRVLLARFWQPLSNITATQIEATSGDLLVPRGDSLELSFQSWGLRRPSATMEIVPETAEAYRLELLSDPDRPDQFRHSIAALENSFRYRLRAGDGRTSWHRVTAIDRPFLEKVTLTLTAPAHVDRPVYQKDYLPSHVQAVEGSLLQLAMRPAGDDLQEFALEIHSGSPSGTSTAAASERELRLLRPDGEGWYRFETRLTEDLLLTPRLKSSYGLANVDRQDCRVRVLPDRPPVARVISPTEEQAVRPDEVLDIKFEAHDDHGIVKAELIVYEESAADGSMKVLSVEEIPLGDQMNEAHLTATAQLDLSKYELREGMKLSYAVRVTDNRSLTEDWIRGEKSSPRSESPNSAAPEEKQAARLAKESGETDVAGKTDTEAVAQTGTDESAQSKADSTATPMNKADANEIAANEPKETAKTASRSADGRNAEPTPPREDLAKSDRSSSEPTKTPEGAAAEGSPPASAEAKDKTDSSGMSERERIAQSAGKNDRESADPQGTPVEQGGDRQAESKETSSTAKRGPLAKNAGDQEETPADDLAKAAGQEASDSDKNAGRKEPATMDRRDLRAVSASASAKQEDSLPMNPAEPNVASDAKNDPSAAARPESLAAAASVPPPAEPKMTDPAPRVSTGSRSETGDPRTVPLQPTMTDDLRGQFTESDRLRLKIEEKLISAAEAAPGADRATTQVKIRQVLEQVAGELHLAEESLSSLDEALSRTGIADPQLRELDEVDQRLAVVEKTIAKLRSDTKETPYAFVGLHMVEIGLTQTTPARDRVFALLRQPDVDPQGNLSEALLRVSRARELIAALLVRVERVEREERLADSMEEVAEIYEVYVENLHRFLRAQTQSNRNPLQRKMEIVEVDQEYLDRLREVSEMRRELMAEFAKMLGDDPRLLSKYMELLKRRQTSLRDRLAKLRERQEVIATELSGWLRVDGTQREDVWVLAAELRLQDLTPLAQESSQLEDRVKSQFPLALDAATRQRAPVIDSATQLAAAARLTSAKARRLLRDPTDDRWNLHEEIDTLAYRLSELDAALEQLAFENKDEETTDFVGKRQVEVRSLLERLVGWTELAGYLAERRFAGLAKIDQHQLAMQTELFRLEVNDIDAQLSTEFRGEVPAEVTELATQLKQKIEQGTFHQAAATFDLESDRAADAESQQRSAIQRLVEAEELFDQIRRKVVEKLDEEDPRNPNIADLEDPTLDELLARLEREPNLNALLGLPNRPSNLRVLSDFVASMDGSIPVPTALEEAAEQARQRAQGEKSVPPRSRSKADDDQTEQEWQQVANAEQAAEKLQEKIDELQGLADDPQADPEEAERLRQMARQLEEMRGQLTGRQIDKAAWEEMVRSDQMRAVLRAATRGEPLPSGPWNKLMSSLDDGLWQVRRRVPPEEFRRAIEQYQERIRAVTNQEVSDATR